MFSRRKDGIALNKVICTLEPCLFLALVEAKVSKDLNLEMIYKDSVVHAKF